MHVQKEKIIIKRKLFAKKMLKRNCEWWWLSDANIKLVQKNILLFFGKRNWSIINTKLIHNKQKEQQPLSRQYILYINNKRKYASEVYYK